MELGLAGTIGLHKTISVDEANKWLEENADFEIIDIKFSSVEQGYDILIIYRKED